MVATVMGVVVVMVVVVDIVVMVRTRQDRTGEDSNIFMADSLRDTRL